MKNKKNPWPAALVFILAAFLVLMAWSVNRAAHSPGAAVVEGYRTSAGR